MLGLQGVCSFLVCVFSVRNLKWLRIVQEAVGFRILDFGNDRISSVQIVARLAHFRALLHDYRSFRIAAVTSARHLGFHGLRQSQIFRTRQPDRKVYIT